MARKMLYSKWQLDELASSYSMCCVVSSVWQTQAAVCMSCRVHVPASSFLMAAACSIAQAKACTAPGLDTCKLLRLSRHYKAEHTFGPHRYACLHRPYTAHSYALKLSPRCAPVPLQIHTASKRTAKGSGQQNVFSPTLAPRPQQKDQRKHLV